MSGGVAIWLLGASLLVSGIIPALSGCRGEDPRAPEMDHCGDPEGNSSEDGDIADLTLARGKALKVILQRGTDSPAGLITLHFAGQDLTFWPYTGSSFDGCPIDPINLVFVGQADPVQIRAALLALDGDRTSHGFPSGYPFDSTWSDCLGGEVQTAYAAEGDGWLGSVVQLTLGDYEPLRFHLRLFRTGKAFRDGVWTLAGAHFETLIPGTADHQVLSWELAQQIVTVDLMRSGLLHHAAPQQSTGLINAAPSFREIPTEIYNGLPAELIARIDGPAQPVVTPVPLLSDGEGTILHLARTVPTPPGQHQAALTVNYDQLVPKPFCNDGTHDWLHVTGPVEFSMNVTVDTFGRYSYRSGYTGRLEAVSIDIDTGNPRGDPFRAHIGGRQNGWLGSGSSLVVAVDQRLAWQSGGLEFLDIHLRVPNQGRKIYLALIHCRDEDLVAGPQRPDRWASPFGSLPWAGTFHTTRPEVDKPTSEEETGC